MPVGVYGHHSGQIGCRRHPDLRSTNFSFLQVRDYGADFSRSEMGFRRGLLWVEVSGLPLRTRKAWGLPTQNRI